MDKSAAGQGVWYWESGVSHFCVRYALLGEATSGACGELTWIEEVAPEDDDRGNGSHMESTQTRTDFLRDGPHCSPPVATVQAMLTFFEASTPRWFDAYRLLIAAQNQDMTTIREMLAQGVPADMALNGLTPIYEAVRQQNHALAELLLAAGVEVNRHFPGSQETILMTLATYAPNASWEPLAAHIVVQGADLEARNRWDETALMTAAYAGKRLPGLVPLLLRAGAEVNARSLHGYTALMKSVMHRDAPVGIVQQLLEAGANVNACDTEGWPALMWAISNGLVPCVRCLLGAGADVHAVSTPTAKSREAKSVLQLATDYANPAIIAQIRKRTEAS